ncbi:two-component system response regulator [Clostridia bacterium]|nr:two-component system response regulator [Clostridia bacterium]
MERVKPNILVVDDDPIILNSVLAILRDNYTLCPLNSGTTALDYLRQRTPDLIMLDYHMPGVGGLDVLKEIQKDNRLKEIPVIFLTALSEGDGEVKAMRAGAADYIIKPIKPEVLVARVRVQIELVEHKKHLEKLVDERTIELKSVNSKLKAREDITLSLLARLTDMRDEETGDHIIRTTAYTKIIADNLIDCRIKGYNLVPDEVNEIVSCSKLHDLGKIAIPDNILLKEGKLTDEEFDVIKKHPVYAEQFFTEFMDKMPTGDTFLKTALDIAYNHHEKWNGKGYPRGISGEAIPLSGRIVAIADVYDALTTERPYKKAFTHDQAFDIITTDSGTHFDPLLVDVFRRKAQQFNSIREEYKSAPVV